MPTLYTRLNKSKYAYCLHFRILFYIIYDFVLTEFLRISTTVALQVLEKRTSGSSISRLNHMVQISLNLKLFVYQNCIQVIVQCIYSCSYLSCYLKRIRNSVGNTPIRHSVKNNLKYQTFLQFNANFVEKNYKNNDYKIHKFTENLQKKTKQLTNESFGIV